MKLTAEQKAANKLERQKTREAAALAKVRLKAVARALKGFAPRSAISVTIDGSIVIRSLKDIKLIDLHGLAIKFGTIDIEIIADSYPEASSYGYYDYESYGELDIWQDVIIQNITNWPS